MEDLCVGVDYCYCTFTLSILNLLKLDDESSNRPTSFSFVFHFNIQRINNDAFFPPDLICKLTDHLLMKQDEVSFLTMLCKRKNEQGHIRSSNTNGTNCRLTLYK